MSFSAPVVQVLFVVPQEPFIGIESEQLAFDPPLLPVHAHRYWVAESAESFNAPAVHALRVVPHAPFTGLGREQLAFVPPFEPVHVQR